MRTRHRPGRSSTVTFAVFLALSANGCADEPVGVVPTRVLALETRGDLAVDGDTIFFTDQRSDVGLVLRADLDGSNEQTLATLANAYGTERVVVGGDSVFSAGGNNLYQLPRAGGAAALIGGYEEASPHPRAPLDLAADAKGLAVAADAWPLDDIQDGAIDTFDTTGASMRTVDPGGALATAIDDDFVYWTSRTAVMRRPRAPNTSLPPPSETIADGLELIDAPIVVSATQIIWLDHARLMAAPKSGGPPVVLSNGDPDCANDFGANHLAVDESSVYWSTYWVPEDAREPGYCRGFDTIVRVPLAGGPVTVLVAKDDVGWPGRIALSAHDVYYVRLEGDGSGGAIMRVPKQ